MPKPSTQADFDAAIALLTVNIAGAIRSAVDNPAKAELIISNIPHYPGMELLRAVNLHSPGAGSCKRVVLHRNGDPIHFDVSVNFQALAESKGWKAERSSSHRTKVAEGAVTVEHIP